MSRLLYVKCLMLVRITAAVRVQGSGRIYKGLQV
jgi:hypothetical protein